MTPLLQDCFASMAFAAGAVVTSPEDLARFTRALMTGTLLTPASMGTMRTCTTVNFGDGCNGYGYGCMRYTYAGRDYFGHGGDIYGFTQMSVHSEEDSVTFTLSINRSGAPRGPIAGALLAAVHQGLDVGIIMVEKKPPTLELYPVPAHERVTLRSTALRAMDRIELLDAAGQRVRSEQCARSGMHELVLTGLAPGVYSVHWISAQGPVQRALIIQ
jgi:hypothetical protein